MASCNNQERFARVCSSISEVNGYFQNSKYNNAHQAQWRSRALNVEIARLPLKARNLFEFVADIWSILCVRVTELDNFVIQSANKIAEPIYSATQRSAGKSGIRSEGPRSLELVRMLTGAPFSASRGFVRTFELSFEPGPQSARCQQNVPVRFVAMRKHTRSASDGPAITHNSSGGGRD